MTSTSSVPAVLTALYNLATTVYSGELVAGAVIFGQPLPNQYDDFAAIGWNGESSAVELSQDNADMTAAQVGLEAYDVHSQIVSWNGDPGKAADVCTRAYQLLDLFAAGLNADVHLGGACNVAQLAGSDYQPAQTAQGPMAVLTFTVHVNATRSNA